MSNFTFSPTDIPGVQIVDVKSFGDARGYFMETFRAADFAAAGITDAFVQDNQSCSHRGVLRGLHFQKRHQQAKLVRAISAANTPSPIPPDTSTSWPSIVWCPASIASPTAWPTANP